MSWKTRTTLREAYQLWGFNKRPRTVVQKVQATKTLYGQLSNPRTGFLGRLQNLCLIYLFKFEQSSRPSSCMAGLALPRPGLVGRKRGNGREIHFEHIITAMRNCDLRMLCFAIPGWPPSHLFLRTYSAPFFFFLLLGIPTRRSQLGCFFISPLTPTSGPAYPESKKKKKNSTYAQPTSSPSTLAPSTSKQTTPESKKKRLIPVWGCRPFFVRNNTTFHSYLGVLHANPKKSFLSNCFTDLLLFASFYPSTYGFFLFQKKKAENQKPARVISFFLYCSRLILAFNRHEKTLRI